MDVTFGASKKTQALIKDSLADDSQNSITVSKARTYLELTKVRLTTSVVISAVAGFLIGANQVRFVDLLLVILGGFMVVGSSNGFNQVIERAQDAIMDRTKNRPLPSGRLSVLEAMIFSTVIGLLGLALLWIINPLSALFGALSLFLYTCVYTPLKGRTPLAVFVGAFPGAIPFMLGWVAATNDFDIEPGMLFAIQFFWQFPHFWAIAWMLDDDYKKVGYNLLPNKGRTKDSAFQIILYTGWMIVFSLIPAAGMAGELTLSLWAAAIVGLLGLYMMYRAVILYRSMEIKDARKLLYASLMYLPLLQLIYVIDLWK